MGRSDIKLIAEPSPEAYKSLAAAIIIQAVKEYRMAIAKLKRHPRDYEAEDKKKQIEKWVKTAWFATLSENSNGEEILKKIREAIR